MIREVLLKFALAARRDDGCKMLALHATAPPVAKRRSTMALIIIGAEGRHAAPTVGHIQSRVGAEWDGACIEVNVPL